MSDDWLSGWMRRKARPIPRTAMAAAKFAARTRHAADLLNKLPARAPWQEVVIWLRECGRKGSLK